VKSERRFGSASAGIPVTVGSSASTRFTFALGPSILMPATALRKSSGSALGSTSLRNVLFGSAFESTRREESSVPSSSTTPLETPSSTEMRATGALVRISTPALRQAEAIAWVIAPIPPITWP
jgi:hypothetical protein